MAAYLKYTALVILNTWISSFTTDKFLARPTSRCILFDGENISFDASIVFYIHSFIQYSLWRQVQSLL